MPYLKTDMSNLKRDMRVFKAVPLTDSCAMLLTATLTPPSLMTPK
jgi:hypothetical protein